MKKILLILPVFLVITGGQGKPRVAMFPDFPGLYVGDEVTFRCQQDSNVLTTNVQWWFKNSRVPSNKVQNGVLHKPAVTSEDAGQYECEHNGQKSDRLEVTVEDMLPPAQLSIVRRNSTAVIADTESVLLQLYVEEGLHGWSCYFTDNDTKSVLKLDNYDWEDNNRSVIMTSYRLNDNRRSLYWCMKGEKRSNIVTLIATDKIVSLQMSENPAMKEESVSLFCEVWGGAQVFEAFFYKDGTEILRESKFSNTYVIKGVTSDNAGVYSCKAKYSYTHMGPKVATRLDDSDEQVLQVRVGPPVASLEESSGILSCSCPECSPTSYRWYVTEGTKTTVLGESGPDLNPPKNGKYRCRAVRGIDLSLPSDEIDVTSSPTSSILWMLVVVALLVLLMIVVAAVVLKKRSAQTQIGQKKLDEGGEGGYEQLTMKEGTYHTLKGGAEKKEGGEGEYEQLTVKETTYHTLKGGAEKKEGGEGEYEQLTLKEGTYHTLKGGAQSKEGEAEGAYQALKLNQEEKDKEEYQTLKEQSQGKEQYQTLQNVQAEVYQTIKQEKAEGGAEAGAEGGAGQEGVAPREGEAGQAEGGYEQLPLKETAADPKSEDNPYEELKAEQKGKRKTIKDKK